MFTLFLIFVCVCVYIYIYIYTHTHTLNDLQRQLNERPISNEHAFKIMGYFIITWWVFDLRNFYPRYFPGYECFKNISATSCPTWCMFQLLEIFGGKKIHHQLYFFCAYKGEGFLSSECTFPIVLLLLLFSYLIVLQV